MRRLGRDAFRSGVAAVLGGAVAGLVLIGGGVVTGTGAAGAGAGGSSADARAVYRAAAPAVVSIMADDREGSGFLVDAEGHVVTNAHVVGGARTVEVTVGARRIPARVRGVEESIDLAVLELTRPAGEVRPLTFASGDPRIGDPVVAIGAPFGLGGSLSSGIVSGLRRQIEAPNGFAIVGAIQTDAALNPGNSGGPLLDLSGRVVGVATQIATEGGRNEGVGFAIPADAVRPVVRSIIATGRAALPYLGISGADTPEGVLIGEVLAGGPVVGILRPGDVLTTLDGDPVVSNADLADRLAGRAPGDRIRLGILRDGQRTELDAELAARPKELPAP